MSSQIIGGAIALIYGYKALEYTNDAIEQEVDFNELPQGRVHPSMGIHIEKELSEALERKSIAVRALTPLHRNNETLFAKGIAGNKALEIKGLAVITLSPEIFAKDAKAAEWRVAREIGTISEDPFIVAVKRVGALATIALWSHVFMFPKSSVRAFEVAYLSDRLFDFIAVSLPLAKESLTFANSVTSKEQLEGGIRYLKSRVEESVKKLKERQEWLSSYHPYLGDAYAECHRRITPYLPTWEKELSTTLASYEARFGNTKAPVVALAPTKALEEAQPKEAVQAA